MILEKRVGLFLGFCSLASALSLVFRTIQEESSIIGVFSSSSLYILLLTAVILFFFSSIKNKTVNIINKYFHVLICFLFGSISILDNLNNWYWIGLFLIGLILSAKYGITGKNYIVKTVLLFIYIISLVILQIIKSNYSVIHSLTIESIIYIIFIFSILLICYSDSISIFLTKEQRIERKISNINNKLMDLKEENTILETELSTLKKPVDLSEYKFTNTEMEILKALVSFKESNKELANRFNNSQGTIRIHIQNIREKMDINDRWKIIDLLRNNF